MTQATAALHRKGEQTSHARFDIWVMVRIHRKLSLLPTTIVLAAAVLLAQKFFLHKEEDLNRVDVMSELSLSTL